MGIAVLDDQLISQIAAGEVVERPASIIKELVENSLDAGATDIQIRIEQGGLRRIVITDNGRGIPQDELALALARHATSKIDSLAALEAVTSLGFRGEALASIASVADLRLTSRAQGAGSAYQVQSQRPHTPQPAPHPQGTTLDVRDLFAQVPARRKFLRTAGTEFKHIKKTAERMALSRPDVAFSLEHDGREIWRLPACHNAQDDRARIAKICGKQFDDHALVIDETAAGMRLTGWIATPGFSRSQADLQYSYVNQRFIRDRVFSHAVKLAYRDVLHNQRHPAYVLYLSMPGSQVDVNAHPTKAEVRFRQSSLVHDFVFRTLAKKLSATAETPDQAQDVNLAAQMTGQALPSSLGHHHRHQHFTQQPHLPLRPSKSQTLAAYQFQQPTASPQDAGIAETVPTSLDERANESAAAVPALGYAVGQVHNIYIVAQNQQGMVLVDMHAAHERILYERLKAEYSAGEIAAKALLIPETLVVTEDEANLAEQHAELLGQLGLDISRSSPTQLLLRSVPAMLAGQKDCALLLRDVLADLGDGRGSGERVRHVIDDLLADVGCKAAIKAGHKLTLQEMNNLLRDMEGTQHAGHCNHGRPSWIQVDMASLDRLFMRGQ